MTRRDFLRVGSAAGAWTLYPRALGSALRHRKGRSSNPLDALTQPKFVNSLPVPHSIDLTSGGAVDISVRQESQWLGLVDPGGQPIMTTVWGYEGQYPGPTLLARKNVPVSIRWRNELRDVWGAPLPHLLSVDSTLHWADPLGQGMIPGPYTGPVPLVTHLHGARSQSGSDGLPESWFTPGFAITGPSFQEIAAYGNHQDGATLWYHDHALGITRLNVYTGLAGFYLLRGEDEDALVAANQLPSCPYEIGLAIQDRQFLDDGSLYYPSEPEADEPSENEPPNPSTHPETFGEFILVNGMTWPYLRVEPRQYRFRILNGSDSRFYELYLSNAQPFLQIGTDQGLLNSPVTVSRLLVAPGERADVVLDFSGRLGQTIVVKNHARSPFPKGEPTEPQTSGQIMQFRVDLVLDGSRPLTTLPSNLRPVTGPIQPLGEAVRTRKLLLFESHDEYGRLMPMLGTVTGGVMPYDAPITETPRAGEVEIWEVHNTTPDAHPVHLHLVAFQVLGRQKFRATQDPVTGALSDVRMIGRSSPPAPNEAGWKDTAVMYPGEVTRIIARFDIRGVYVWHCHILSHEDHEMMRPFEVVP